MGSGIPLQLLSAIKGVDQRSPDGGKPGQSGADAFPLRPSPRESTEAMVRNIAHELAEIE